MAKRPVIQPTTRTSTWCRDASLDTEDGEATSLPLFSHPLFRPTTPCSRQKEGQVTTPNLLAPISFPLPTKQALSPLQAIVAARLGRIVMGKGTGQKVTIRSIPLGHWNLRTLRV